MSVIAEYIWTGLSSTDIRSKVRVTSGYNCAFEPWSCDGSSCGHGSVEQSEYPLMPVMYVPCPMPCIHYIVLCDSESRRQLVSSEWSNNPWFGLEQEYFIVLSRHQGYSDNHYCGHNYCGQGVNPVERAIVQEHLNVCLLMGLAIGGTNAEVAQGQWEFQIGPLGPVEACDQLIVARFLLMRIAEKYGCTIDFRPKPFAYENGSGCHINVSTEQTRSNPECTEQLMPLLQSKHDEFIRVCGVANRDRLTGQNETADYRVFTWGKGTRNTSVRINNGYYEDRRPGADIDPYLAIQNILGAIASS